MNKHSLPRLVVVVAWLLAPLAAQDAERDTHTDTASTPQVSHEAKGQGWLLRQYQLGCLSHLSYLLVVGDRAVVVDPQRDVEHYEADAKALGARITDVWLTHPHADFVAGHTELAHRTGATIAVSALAKAGFAHRALQDGDRLQLGPVTLEAWLTPGHTPNAMTFLVHVPDAEQNPAFALTGDTLFVGSIGRPDLLDVPPAELAAQSFASVQRLKTLPDSTVVMPAHGAGSLCGAHLSPDTTSTIGREKATNPYLQIASRASFVANIISHQPVAPQYFGFNVELNRKGPPLVERGGALPPLLDGAAVQKVLADGGWIVDLREQTAYAAAHVEGAINVALRGRLDTWTGIVVPFAAAVVLVGDDAAIAEGTFRLRRIGYDHQVGRLGAEPASWRAAGLAVRSSKLITPQQLHAAMLQGKEPLIIDVRTADEYADLRLGDVGNIPVTDHERFAKVLGKDASVVTVCNSAYRSSMAIGLLERHGFHDVASLDGGLDAWLAAGLPTIGRQATGAVVAAAASAPTPALAMASIKLALPEPIDAAMLRKVLLDQPTAYQLIDVRPAWQFAEWTLPGAVNVPADALAAHLAALPADARIVLLDRDGSHAFALAGALMAQQPQRLLRVLHGGLIAFHRELPPGAEATLPVTAAPAAAAASTNATNPAPTKPAAKKRSAGC
ncbi:MAG: rhodanese-like domain-containing protein [Planctomycetes bacterium]|jgi:glyoxylase-like metal-dependent hydrolase (beta-lactamase superfamily II)/rhodanese-related sulfurtransferase|nr:rhodanese-like domain-containing protein [Planctomycetota bacterium]